MNVNIVNHYNALNYLIDMFKRNYKVSFTHNAKGLRTDKWRKNDYGARTVKEHSGHLGYG